MQPATVGFRARFFVSNDAVPQISPSSGSARNGQIAELLSPALESMGYELVRARLSGKTLQIMVERRDRTTMTVDDCAEASAAISAILDDADPIAGAFELEVSSPGLDRPLTRPDDVRRFAGLEAWLELDEPIAGQRRFTGRLDGVEDDGGAVVVMTTADGPVRLPWEAVKKAKLVLNDALMRAAERWAEEGRSP